ncbi:HDOD domain-containing protein [Gemmatimonas sp.]|uniref:HDOD domain-containing protein n=1 Tax=Gemmatimonas sp. TaxID=1962908 RepID=UPI00286C335A|nr:HDOD domain-containing protein [Gemmatimonas sp.]
MPANAPHLQIDPADPDESPVRARMSRILEGSDFPALSKQIIETISALDDDASSLQRLANVVLREYSLTLSVVRTANSVHYRRSGRSIQSATHAMMMLGAKTVRQLASSLLLFENFHRRSPALKELMLQSLLTANHAREVANKLQMQEPEEAHLCGMFRNLGEVLIACHFGEDYARIQTMMHDEGKSETGATKAVLGFPYADLGAEVSRHWGMPDAVVQGMRARASTSVSLSAAVTAFSHDLTVALYSHEQTPDGAGVALEEVIERHSAKIKISREHVREVIASALNETRELFSSLHIPSDRMRFKQLSESARSAIGVAAFETGEWAAVTASSEDDALQLRDRLRQELESAADASSGTALGDVLLLALEGALRGGPFDRVIVCILDADKGRLVARSGLGEGIEALLPHFDFPMNIRGGPVVTATQQRAPIYLPNDRSMNAIEARWAGTLRVAQFGVFPIVVSGKIVGCLYVDRAMDGEMAAITPDRAALRYVKSLSEIMVTAIAARRRLSTAVPVEPVRETPKSAVPAAAGVEPARSGADRVALVLQLLQGASSDAVSKESGVSVVQLEAWRAEVLAAAAARLQ